MQSWNWESLRSVVQDVIDRDGIGRPAALRFTFHGRGAGPEADRYLKQAEGLAASWFGSQPASTYSIGGSGKPAITALKWSGGQNAILSVSAGASGRVGGNAMLMGSRGTIYHEIGDTESWSA